MTAYWCEYALVGGIVERGVTVEISGTSFSRVVVGSEPGTAEVLPGLTTPGFANCHSHAFHRALRGRTQVGRGSFWTWREQMYALAARLDPDSYFRLARLVYAEMAAVGITSVGEFHYLHHPAAGGRYDDPNAMGSALVAAARDAGIRIALLDTCYLAAGIGRPPDGVQARFDDGSAGGWAERVDGLVHLASDTVVVGGAVHSVRAVPREQIPVVASWTEGRAAPLHVHLSEQVAENDECLAAYGRTPTQVLSEGGALSPRTTAVHATHLTDDDISMIGAAQAAVCLCPTTERDLGDGIGPASRLDSAGARLTLGSDSHAVIDPFEEMRGLELDERLASQARGRFTAADLVRHGTAGGHRSLGFTDVGVIEVGARADLVTIDLASVRTAGTGASVETVVFAASGADVAQVMCEGAVIVRPGDAFELGRRLDETINALWDSR
jgi:formiminoglutamate deiminase